MFYVYEWFIVDTGEIFYVGKGCNHRYKVRKHNKFFNDMIKRYKCDSRIVKTFNCEKDAVIFMMAVAVVQFLGGQMMLGKVILKTI